MKTKRLLAFIIDLLLVGLIIYLISLLFPVNQNVNALNQELNNINDLILSKQINYTTYINRFSDIMHDLDKQTVIKSVINIVILITYFVVIPYFKDGKTLGLKLLKIKIKRNDNDLLTLNDLLIRSFIVNGLAYFLISLVVIYLSSGLVYFIMLSILGLCQIGVALWSGFMVIYRKDEKGLQDILSNTSIVEEKN